MDLTHLCMYDISISHPRSWSLQSNPNKVLAYDQGMLKLDKVESASDVSLSLKWFPLEGFDGGKYVHSLREGLRKRFKSKLFDFAPREVEQCGHTALIVDFTYVDNHGIYKVWRKDERVSEKQVMLACPASARVIIANIAALAETMERRGDELHALLASLRCHVDPD